MDNGSTAQPRRYAILTEGLLEGTHGKTAHGVLRYRSSEVVAVVDSTLAGRALRDVLPSLESDVPIVASVAQALTFSPTTLLVGVATEGGKIPHALRAPILQAIDAGLEIISGLHELLTEDREIVERARRSGARLWDVRIPPRHIPLFSGKAYAAAQHVVLAVGSDCAVGKMTALLEIERAASASGARAQFLATGQTGILIAGQGIAVDRVISDFVTGAAEQLVVNAAPDADVLLVEGQGSIFHPAYAPVTFGLLYGSAPDALVLCHRPGKTHIDGFDVRLPDLRTLIRAYEDVLRPIKRARVIAVALDTSALDADQAAKEIAYASAQTGLPVDDPVRNGGRFLWNALANAFYDSPKGIAKHATART